MTATLDDLLTAYHAQTALIGSLVSLAEPAAQQAVPGLIGSAGPSSANPKLSGLIQNPLSLPFLTISNRSAVPLGITPAGKTGDTSPPAVATYTVPPLHRACLAVRPDRAVLWSMAAPGPAAWTAAKRNIPYVFHAGGGPMLERLYPDATMFTSQRPAAIDSGISLIIGAAAAARPASPDAVLVSATVALDAMAVGAVADLVSIEACYDLAGDGVTPAAPWGSIFPFAGGGQQVGAIASIDVPGATGIQVTNHNVAGGQTISVYVNLFYGVPA
jgi:hypothetical protein